jgi:hypothetical protein
VKSCLYDEKIKDEKIFGSCRFLKLDTVTIDYTLEETSVIPP